MNHSTLARVSAHASRHSPVSFTKRLIAKTTSKQTSATISKPVIIQKMAEQLKRRASSSFHDPRYQAYYGYKDSSWQETAEKPPTSNLPSTIKLLTWNIDFQMPNGPERMAAALQYVASLISDKIPADVPTVIFFQEMTPSDLETIQSTPWIQARFYLTDTSPKDWVSNYCTYVFSDSLSFLVPHAGSQDMFHNHVLLRQVSRLQLHT